MSGHGHGGGFPSSQSMSQLTMEILNGGGDTWLSPMTHCSTFPFLILRNHALLNLVAANIASWVT